MKFSFGKRAVHPHKFYFFYSPLLKETMKENNFVFFWWIGPYYFTCRRSNKYENHQSNGNSKPHA